MPINARYRWFYPIDWPQLSAVIRFKRAQGKCEGCGRPHGHALSMQQRAAHRAEKRGRGPTPAAGRRYRVDACGEPVRAGRCVSWVKVKKRRSAEAPRPSDRRQDMLGVSCNPAHSPGAAHRLKVEADEVYPRPSGHTPLMDRVAAGVEKARQACPGEITVEAGAPDHRADTARAQIKSTDRRFGKAWRDGFGWIGFRRWLFESGAKDVFVDEALLRGRCLVGEADIFTEVVAEMHLVAIDTGDAAEQGGALPAERLKADGPARAKRGAGYEVTCLIWHGRRLVEDASVFDPVHDVVPAVAPRLAPDSARREVDRAPAGLDKIFSDLHP